MIKTVLFWGFLLLGGSIIAQDRSIRFETLSFQEALDKAKAGNRLLFVDCYTAWCGPCKMLAKDVFTKNEVAVILMNTLFRSKWIVKKEKGLSWQNVLG